jgi:ferredoxin
VIPYLLVADLQNTALAAFLSFSGRVLYPTYGAAPRLWNLSALDDQAAAGAIMWVPGSLAFLIPTALIAVQLLNARRGVRPREFFAQTTKQPVLATAQATEARAPAPLDARMKKWAEGPAPLFDLLRVPGIGAILRWPPFRRVAQTVMFLLALLIVADGLLGSQLSPMNLAGVLPWTHWRGLAVIALLAAGNFFCMACPFMLVRDLGRRVLSARWAWPRALRSKWFAIALLALYFWAYEAFSLWDSPWWTAWIAVGYFAAALVIDGLFKGASFCKYVCPIGQFNFVQSLSSPLEVKVREPEVCHTCTTHDCIRGNATQRGCELHLFQPHKSGNMDCTFCLDCIKACPCDNVGILAVAPALDLTRDAARSGVGAYARRPDLAALVLLLVFGAFVNAAGMIAPVVQWQSRLSARFGLHSTLPIITTLLVVTLLLVPPLLALSCGWLSRTFSQAGRDFKPSVLSLTCDFTVALAPLGLAMWVGHFVFHLLIGAQTAVPALQRAANDIGLAWLGTPEWTLGSFAFVRDWLPRLRLLLLDGGLLLSLYVAWRIAHRQALQFRSAAGAFAPWAALATILFGVGVWIFLHPMQMRGMSQSMM